MVPSILVFVFLSLGVESSSLTRWMPPASRGPIAWSDQSAEPDPADQVLEEALALLGSPYRRGGTNPKVGIDCAQFVRRAYATIGIDLPWSSASQIGVGRVVEKDELEPGDLVFFKNTYKRGISHVGLYLGNGEFVHASSRRRGVIVSPLDTPYYRQHWAGARRLLPDVVGSQAAAIGVVATGPAGQ